VNVLGIYQRVLSAGKVDPKEKGRKNRKRLAGAQLEKRKEGAWVEP